MLVTNKQCRPPPTPRRGALLRVLLEVLLLLLDLAAGGHYLLYKYLPCLVSSPLLTTPSATAFAIFHIISSNSPSKMLFSQCFVAATLLGASAVSALPFLPFLSPPPLKTLVVLVAPSNQLIFQPNQIEADPGTVLQFIFTDGVSSYFTKT
jgi:hypothetical protein